MRVIVRRCASGRIGAVLLLLSVAARVAAEPAADSSVGTTGTLPHGEMAKPAAQAPLEPTGRPTQHRQGRLTEADRLQVLVKALKLDAAQEAEVRRALLDHREAIRRLARAPADPEVPRVAAIQAITRRTSERIRGVLNDEQRRLYGQALPKDLPPGEGKFWVDEALRSKRK